MTNPKVFEFAKEIGMTPLALMDKIKEWQLPVKSHMAELEQEVLVQLQAKLAEEKKPSGGSKKESTVRKKTSSGAQAETSDKVAKSAAKASVKSTSKKPVKPETVAQAKTKVAVTQKLVTPVVRRKAKTAEELKEAKASGAESSEVEDSQQANPPNQGIEAEVIGQEAINTEDQIVIETERKVLPPQAEPEVIPIPEAPIVAKEVVAKPVPVAEDNVRKGGVSRKKEVAIGQSGVTSELTPAQTLPKRNIVGRMDLSRVTNPGGPGRPQAPLGVGQRTMGGVATGTGFAQRPKGNLRAGFVQAPAPELPRAEGDDFDRKKEDKRRAKPGVAEGPAKELEEQPPAFDAAEFRKREMVFQPKKKKGMLGRPSMQTQMTTPAAHKRIVKVFGTMKVSDLAVAMGVKATELIKALMKNGAMATLNTDLDFDTIALMAPEFKFEAQNIERSAEAVIGETAFGNLEAEPILRSPVVAVMGHVDHGKTSLLDAIRETKVADGEAGGITQHIGAYQVTLKDKSKITFLDTPGHEAFTAMRARGANVTDIAVIVVAADDGVMPQTAEAINHAKAANVPIIVVVNKIDKPGANIERIKQQLTEFEIVPEEWGGQNIFCNVSALKKTGINELLEQIKLQAEVLELKANPKRSGTGTVIEARLEKGRGSVATILVQNGSVKVGQFIVAGSVKGRIRSLISDRGERIEEAGPGMPVEVLGLDAVPSAGDKFDIVVDEKAAEEISGIRQRHIDLAKQNTKKLSLEEIFAKVQKGDVKELLVILKTDVAGSLEAIQGMFAKLSTHEVKVRIIHAAIGGITESDVLLASTSNGLIIGFNVRPDPGATQAAKKHNIEIRTYSIVYELIDEMKKAMVGMLKPDIVEKVMGRAEVRNTFTVPKIGTIAGCLVSDGKIQRSNQARLIRDGKIVFEGKIGSLKRFKDDAKEVATGFECGIGIENFNDIKVGDSIEAFIKEEVARELSSMGAEA